MPIFLNTIQDDLSNMAVNTAKQSSPKFFDAKLTGKGGQTTVGLLSMKNNPPAILPTMATSVDHYRMKTKKTTTNGATTIYSFPVNPLRYDTWKYMQDYKRPDINELIYVGTGHSSSGKKISELYILLRATALTLEETIVSSYYTGTSKTEKKFTPTYQMFFFNIADKNDEKFTLSNIYNAASNENKYWYAFTSNPIKDWTEQYFGDLCQNHFRPDNSLFIDYMTTFDLHDAVAECSEIWQTSIDKTLDEFFKNMHDHRTNRFNHQSSDLRIVKDQVKYIMNYKIPLDLYRNIYKSIITNFSADDANEICKQNLNLLLSDTLQNLDANKAQLITFQKPANIQTPASTKQLSVEQLAAVESTEPLILVQAGAGTGKSTLILARIDYLQACGVNPEDITVLSFTNAAADHITEKNPNVHSMTIARMIHEIYTTNFSGHELSSLDTIANSLEIYYPQTINSNNVVSEFAYRIRSMIKNDANNFTEMNNFIEAHYDEVIDILNTIHQTSLELEIIICYQKIDTFIEPSHIQSKFLIIDEVQDNSVFEFVYTLKYIDKHKQSMFIVGDCSQTLYEFRASNPRALNILESSGTFATFQLNINYRSNQEILDFANVGLGNIEANQYAHIQLRANSRAKVTEQSFLEKVHFNYHQLAKMSDFKDALPSIFAREIKPYIEDCLKRGEQVAFLAFTRHDVNMIRNILIHQFPNINPNTSIVNLVPEKTHNTTVMSAFIKKYWNEIKFVPSNNIISTITNAIMTRLPYLVYNDQKAAPRVRDLLFKWASEHTSTIDIWVNELNNGQITQSQFLDYVKENMLQFEIESNAVKQALISSQNEQAKKLSNTANAPFLLSTIHSAKGLEFDNTVILYKNERDMPEDKKRMYYVAFTRAMKSEYILAYDTMVLPQIEADYMTVLEQLHATSPAPNSPFNKQPKNKRIQI